MKLKIMAVIAMLAGSAAFAAAIEGVMNITATEVDGRLVDDINLPFVNDPAVLGEWVSVDFVRVPEDFVPAYKRFQGDLYLGGFKFLPEGAMAVMPFAPGGAPWYAWTKGVVMHKGDKTAERYTIKEINGATYMFFEWKSGDYSIRHQKPQYYVLKKV